MSAVDLARLVKPLEWEESLKGRWIGTPVVKFADYARWIFQVGGQFHYVNNDSVRVKYPTLAAAQAAANADHAARVLAAMDADLLAELVGALKGLTQAIESSDDDFQAYTIAMDNGYTRARLTLAKLGVQP